MSVSPRPPAEMTPQERLEEFARLCARGMVRLSRRLSRPSVAPPRDMELPAKNDLRSSPS